LLISHISLINIINLINMISLFLIDNWYWLLCNLWVIIII